MASAMRRASVRGRLRQVGRHARDLENVRAVLVFADVEAFDGAVPSARGDDGDLARERHERFDDARLSADLAPRRREIGAVVDGCLAFAVVAEPPRLEHRRPADPVERGCEL